ncbi:MAG: hypothetical protein Q4G67_07685 [Actinomycetia bacterium]|nr:hypothetical protein [Actinomycetes bacterium]
MTERRWAGDPTVLLLALVPLAGWTGYLAWLGRPLPALALAGIVAAVALAGST